MFQERCTTKIVQAMWLHKKTTTKKHGNHEAMLIFLLMYMENIKNLLYKKPAVNFLNKTSHECLKTWVPRVGNEFSYMRI